MSKYLPRSIRSVVIGIVVALTALLTVSLWVSKVFVPNRSPHIGAVPLANRSAGQPGPTPTQGRAPRPLPRSVPVRVSVPAIDADSSLTPLGLTQDGTLEVPPVEEPMQAGWYSLSPTPGEAGASVIVGHVDGYHEPGIFYQLYKLKRGDQIIITRQDGTTARFAVYRTTQVDKDDFPTTQVYASTPGPELRLITCGGIFNRASGNYTDNIIVFAALAASR